MNIITSNEEKTKKLRDLTIKYNIKFNIQGNLNFKDYTHYIGPLADIKNIKEEDLPKNIWVQRANKYGAVYNHLDNIVILSAKVGLGSTVIFEILYANYEDIRELFRNLESEEDLRDIKKAAKTPIGFGGAITSCIAYIKRNCLGESKLTGKDYFNILEEKFIKEDYYEETYNLIVTYYNYMNATNDPLITTNENKKSITNLENISSNPLENAYKINENFYNALKGLENYIINNDDVDIYLDELKKELSNRLSNGESVSNLQDIWEKINKIENDKKYVNELNNNITTKAIDCGIFAWFMNIDYNIPRNIGKIKYITYDSNFGGSLSSKTYFILDDTKEGLIPGNAYKVSKGSHVAFLGYLKTPQDYKELKKFVNDQNFSINDIEKCITTNIEDDKPLNINENIQQLIDKVVI